MSSQGDNGCDDNGAIKAAKERRRNNSEHDTASASRLQYLKHSAVTAKVLCLMIMSHDKWMFKHTMKHSTSST